MSRGSQRSHSPRTPSRYVVTGEDSSIGRLRLSLREFVLVSPDFPEEFFIPRDWAIRTLVGEDHGVVDAQLINATAPANELWGKAELSLNPRRQTGGGGSQPIQEFVSGQHES